MRCSACNKALNDFEATLKSATTGEYLDTCLKCLDGLGIVTQGRKDLSPYEDAEVYDDFLEEPDEGPITLNWEDEE